MNLALKTKILESKKPQIAIAKEIGIPESHLSKIVNGWVDPGDELKNAIAGAIGCKTTEIFSFEKEISD